MVQATAALLAVALTVTVSTALAANPPSCEQIQKRAEKYTMAQVRSRMERMKIPQQWRVYVENCLKDKK